MISIGMQFIAFARKVWVRAVLISAGALVGVVSLFAQQPNIASPNAASLGQYGQVPVDLYTGKVDVTVPLYTVSCGSLSLPISLGYYQSSLKPNDPTSWVGLNMNLNCGGAVTRAVKGQPDETAGSGYFTKGSILAADDGEYYTEYDGEPDLFYFNFNGYSGKFLMGHDGKFHVIPYQDLKITKVINNDYLDGFSVTTPDGVAYTFGPSILYPTFSEVYKSVEIDWQTSLGTRTTWYLTKITAPNGKDVISLEYTPVDAVGNKFRGLQKTYGQKSAMGGYVFDSGWEHKVESCFSGTPGADYLIFSKTYLSRITTSHGEQVQFSISDIVDIFYEFSNLHPTTGFNCYNQKLDKIKIVNSSFTRRFDFAYLENPSIRLMLLEVTEWSGSEKGRAYGFEYYRDNMPGFPTEMFDHWGYYNAYSSPKVLPTRLAGSNGMVSGFGPERDPNSATVSMGLLRRLTYPTGGYSEFEYGSHDYAQLVQRSNVDNKIPVVVAAANGHVIAGGARISKVTSASDERETDKEVTQYKYVSDYLLNGDAGPSSGILSGFPQYYYGYTFPRSPVGGGAPPGTSYGYHLEFADANSILPLNYTKGNHIGYSEVAEVKSDGSFTVHKFTNFSNRIDKPAKNNISESTTADFIPFSAVNGMDIERGKLTSSLDYRSDKKLVRTKELTYNLNAGRFNENVRAIEQLLPISLPCLGDFWSITAYEIYCYPYYLETEIERLYDVNDPSNLRNTETVTNYLYNSPNHRQLAEKNTTNSDQKVSTTRYKYPQDFAPAEPYQTMVTRNIVNPVVEQAELNGTTVLKDLRTNYYQWSDLVISPVLVEEKSGTGDFTPEVDFFEYDAKGNVLSLARRGDVRTTYLWGYNQCYPVAKIVNATYQEVLAALGQVAIDDLNNNPGTDEQVRQKLLPLRSAATLRKAAITTYTYRPLVGMTSTTDPSGVRTFYEYDNFARLKLIRDQDQKIVKSFFYHFKK